MIKGVLAPLPPEFLRKLEPHVIPALQRVRSNDFCVWLFPWKSTLGGLVFVHYTDDATRALGLYEHGQSIHEEQPGLLVLAALSEQLTQACGRPIDLLAGIDVDRMLAGASSESIGHPSTAEALVLHADGLERAAGEALPHVAASCRKIAVLFRLKLLGL